LSFALLLLVTSDNPQSPSGSGVPICFLAGVSLGVVQMIAGISLLSEKHWACKFAIWHAVANVAVLVLFYLFSLTIRPGSSVIYALKLFVLIMSCLYPAAAWSLLNRPGIQALFMDVPKTHR